MKMYIDYIFKEFDSIKKFDAIARNRRFEITFSERKVWKEMSFLW